MFSHNGTESTLCLVESALAAPVGTRAALLIRGRSLLLSTALFRDCRLQRHRCRVTRRTWDIYDEVETRRDWDIVKCL